KIILLSGSYFIVIFYFSKYLYKFSQPHPHSLTKLYSFSYEFWKPTADFKKRYSPNLIGWLGEVHGTFGFDGFVSQLYNWPKLDQGLAPQVTSVGTGGETL
ncbi:hypothetical protein ACJX0J_027559, partial [Zea mays]